MKRYEPGIPRTIAGCAAVLMTALTLAVCVIGPAEMDSGNRETIVVTTSSEPPIHAMPRQDDITTAIDVVAVRTTGAVMQTCTYFRNGLSS